MGIPQYGQERTLTGLVGGIIAIVLAIGVIIAGFEVVEMVDADEIMVVQSPISGELTWHVTVGIKPQWFGKVSFYKKMSGSKFDSKVMFNDNGTGKLTGKFQVELPLDKEHLNNLHTKYGSQEAIERSLIIPTIDKVVYMTGPLMSSKESSAERKTDLIRFIIDQIEHGVYRTTQKTMTVQDLASKEDRTVMVAEIMMKDAQPLRQEASPIQEFGIKIVNFAPSDLDYDEQVKEQIKKQQEITMEVQTARAHAIEAEQRRLTAEANGKANVMTEQYAQEVLKKKAVVAAERERDVAELHKKEMEFYKAAQILKGDGDAYLKKAVIVADGALEQKLKALVEMNGQNATALADFKGNLVPTVVFGGDGKQHNAATLLELMGAKAAHDLGLNLGIATK